MPEIGSQVHKSGARPPRFESVRRLSKRLAWRGTELELYTVVPPALLLSRLTGIKHEFDVQFKAAWLLRFCGVLLFTYATPWLLVFGTPETAWPCLATFGTLLLVLAYNASGVFKPPRFFELLSVFRGPVEDAREYPGFVFILWVSRYLNCAYFFGISDAAIQVVSGGHAFRIPSGGGGLPDMLYFSISTITALGYGDIVPASAVAKFMAIAEVLGGMWIVLICVVTSLTFLVQGSKHS